MPGQSPEISFDDGADLVIRTFSAFSPDLGEFAVLPEGPDWLAGAAPGTVVVCPPHLVKTIPAGTPGITR